MPTKVDIEILKASLKKIETLKAEIASKRDELRAAIEGVEDIIDSIDEATDGMESGLRSLSDAADAMSKFL